MSGVGFEPTRLSPYDLKSYPLDHSGNLTTNYIKNKKTPPDGFEPPTLRLTAARSNQLS